MRNESRKVCECVLEYKCTNLEWILTGKVNGNCTSDRLAIQDHRGFLQTRMCVDIFEGRLCIYA